MCVFYFFIFFIFLQVKDNQLDLHGGVWSLDGSKELCNTMSTLLTEPDSSSDLSEHPNKMAKVSTTYSGVVSLQGLDHQMSQAHKLGLSLARDLLSKGANHILQAAREQNKAINNPNLPLDKKKSEVNDS